MDNYTSKAIGIAGVHEIFDGSSWLKSDETAHDTIPTSLPNIALPPALCFLSAAGVAFFSYGTINNELLDQPSMTRTVNTIDVSVKPVQPKTSSGKITLKEARIRSLASLVAKEEKRQRLLEDEARHAIAWESLA